MTANERTHTATVRHGTPQNGELWRTAFFANAVPREGRCGVLLWFISPHYLLKGGAPIVYMCVLLLELIGDSGDHAQALHIRSVAVAVLN